MGHGFNSKLLNYQRVYTYCYVFINSTPQKNISKIGVSIERYSLDDDSPYCQFVVMIRNLYQNML